MNSQPARPPTRRAPLGEATRRINNAPKELYESGLRSKKTAIPHHDSFRQDDRDSSPDSLPLQVDYYPPRDYQRIGSPTSNVPNPRLSAISKEYATDSNRNSQISTTSTNVSDGKKIKSHIGPWKLGKTLGKGATARVRLARHAFTGQEAAIKIVQKKSAQISQAGSLAALDKAESRQPKSADGSRTMPIGVEREVAIMKLVQHPNIMRLYDIWENRTEIYLVLEYVDGGELFGAITANGRLTEEAAMAYFRQMLAGVGYCHSLNICHRDLKPENVLLTTDGQIKIADFGMAALHQSPDHKLKTSCGSPHYAAPEVCKGGLYRGDKTDIWSLGVILYATLAGRLPFDCDAKGAHWMDNLLAKIRKGSYAMPEEFSPEAADLIWRILQVNPRERISMDQIWRHDAVRKYDYLDNYGRGYIAMSPSVKDCGRPVKRRSDINKELLRHLRSMWHRLTEQQLMDALLSKEPNDQKLFYTLLAKYRDAQLENYTPELTFSASDYHHNKEEALTKTYSTCHFPQPKSKGHGRQGSRFTVISNNAETERSYDPFKASRPQHLNSMRPADYAKVTIHRRGPSAEEVQDSVGDMNGPRKTSRTSALAVAASDRGRQPARVIASRSSLASSTRSNNSLPQVRAAIGHPRGVSFSHIRRRSTGSQRDTYSDAKLAVVDRHSNHIEVTDNDGDSLVPVKGASSNYIRSKKSQATVSQPLPSASKPGHVSQLWTEDVRQLSTSLAMDCDEAFNRTTVITEIETEAKDPARVSGAVKKSKPFTTRPTVSNQNSRLPSLNNRPLPPPPARSNSLKIELLQARRLAELRKTSGGDESPGYLDRMVSHIDRLMQPSSPDRRTSSAPVEFNHNVLGRPLPSIYEARKEDESPHRQKDLEKYVDSQYGVKSSRIASAPEPRETRKRSRDDRFMRPESGMRDTIRVVDPSSPSPVKIPAPLTIRKKSSQGGPSNQRVNQFGPDIGRTSSKAKASSFELRQQYRAESKVDLARIDEDFHYDEQYRNDSNTGTIIKKKTTWFRRNSKSDERGLKMSIQATDTLPSQTSSNGTVVRSYIDSAFPVQPKKKGFSLGRFFKKSKPDMTLGAIDVDDDASSTHDSIADNHCQPHTRCSSKNSDPGSRQIEPQQNWIAKLFKVKPASKTICFCVSNRRARQEIVTILKDWKRYGIRELQVDKKRNIVFGKVSANNFLQMKQVAFAAEVMKVVEHGKKSHLSIARITQEFGAASSFQYLVDMLETVLKCRGMLVADERKKRMMIKTLNTS